MTENEAVSTRSEPEIDELQVLSVVVQSLRPLNDDSRRRLLQTVLTFFGVDLRVGGNTQVAAQQQPAEQQAGTFSEDRTISPKEFLLEKKPSTEIERVACLGYYLTHYRDTPHFKTVDISKLNTEAAQVKFSNAARAVDNAAKAGYLVQASQGNKQLSAMAEQYVQALPDRAAAKAAVAGSRPRRRVRKTRRPQQVEE
jgi:hypothetical protein